LIQCARLWYENISTFFKNIGFKQNTFDERVFTTKSNMIVVLYVDDEIRWLESRLNLRYEKRIILTVRNSHISVFLIIRSGSVDEKI